MKEGEIKCQRCKSIVIIGTPCEFFESCTHRLERKRIGTYKNMLNSLPIGFKEKIRLSSYNASKND